MSYAHTINTTSADLSKDIANTPFQPSFIIGYTSPNFDINNVARAKKCEKFPGVKMLLCSTAGELCSEDSLRSILRNDGGLGQYRIAIHVP